MSHGALGLSASAILCVCLRISGIPGGRGAWRAACVRSQGEYGGGGDTVEAGPVVRIACRPCASRRWVGCLGCLARRTLSRPGRAGGGGGHRAPVGHTAGCRTRCDGRAADLSPFGGRPGLVAGPGLRARMHIGLAAPGPARCPGGLFRAARPGHVAFHHHRDGAYAGARGGPGVLLSEQAAGGDPLGRRMIAIARQPARRAIGPLPATLAQQVGRRSMPQHAATLTAARAVAGGAPGGHRHHRDAVLGGQMPDRLDHDAAHLP